MNERVLDRPSPFEAAADPTRDMGALLATAGVLPELLF